MFGSFSRQADERDHASSQATCRAKRQISNTPSKWQCPRLTQFTLQLRHAARQSRFTLLDLAGMLGKLKVQKVQGGAYFTWQQTKSFS